MDQSILLIIIGASSLVGGLLVGKLVFARNTKKQVEDAEAQAASILKEAESRAETVKKEKQLEAKERFVQLKAEHDREILEKNKKIYVVTNAEKDFTDHPDYSDRIAFLFSWHPLYFSVYFFSHKQ
mgnify:CR=1 FL=1